MFVPSGGDGSVLIVLRLNCTYLSSIDGSEEGLVVVRQREAPKSSTVCGRVLGMKD